MKYESTTDQIPGRAYNVRYAPGTGLAESVHEKSTMKSEANYFPLKENETVTTRINWNNNDFPTIQSILTGTVFNS